MLLALICVIIAIALLCWAIVRLNPQPPVSWIIYGVIILLCLIVIWHFIGGSVGMDHL